MTITFLRPDGVPLTAQQHRQGLAPLNGGGSGRQLGGRSGFRVGTPSDTLAATSTVWTLKPCSAMIDPGATAHQGMYGWASDADVTGTVTAADATYARKDIVYVQVNDSTAGDGSGAVSANVSYLAGAATASPAAPTLPARSFLLGTITVPQAGGGSPSVALNPARFVAAGGILPATLSERDALTKYDGLTVQRMDLPGRPTQTWDGASWVFGMESIAIPATGGWDTGGQISRVLKSDGSYRYFMDYTAARTTTGFNITSAMTGLWTALPAGWRPTANINFYGALRDNFVNYAGPLNVQMNPDGTMPVSTLTGNTLTLVQYGSIHFTAQWTV